MAFKTVYDRNSVYDNAFRQIAAKNPGFAIGEFIGDILARNYNSRGINKAVNKAMEDFGTGGSLADQQAALQQVKQNMAQQQGNGTGNSMMSEMEALNNVRQNLGLDNQQAQPVISVGVTPQQQNPQELAALTAEPLVSVGVSAQAQPETQEQAVARLAQMPGAGIMAQENAARRMGGFDMKTALANARQQMIKDGRTPYQIEQAMQILNPHFQKMQDDAYKIGAEKIMAELGATDDKGNRVLSDPEYKQKIVDLATQYGDIGKAAANVYGKDIVSGRELWGAQQQQARDDKRYKQQAALKDMDAARQIAVARERAKLYGAIGNGGSRGLFGNRTTGTNVKSPLDSAEFKYIDTAVNKIAEIPAEERTPEQKNFYNQYKGLRDQIMAQSIGNQFGYHTPEERGANASRQTSFNPNNYDQAVPFFKEFAKRGNFKKEDIAKYIRQKYYGLKPDDTSNEFVESIIREI